MAVRQFDCRAGRRIGADIHGVFAEIEERDRADEEDDEDRDRQQRHDGGDREGQLDAAGV